jgi:uncharacterized protein with von Willebrand factor type A (vWA) domain
MLTDFFYCLRAHKLPVSVQEYLTLLSALQSDIMVPTLDSFYYLARTMLIKDETLFDRYDQAFGQFYRQIEASTGEGEIPADWLLKTIVKNLSKEEKAAIEKHGWEKLMALFKKRLEEQKERHAGGNKWIGTGGSSAFGHAGYHPEGIRVGGPSAGNRTAVKVWEQREYRDYDDQQQLGTRNFKIALRRLRRFAREGAELELDLEDTISHTAKNAGFLELQMAPERRNAVKVLMLLDVGGSMDDHVARVEELFSAARSEFRHLQVYYFHNCPYESLWQSNQRRTREHVDTQEILRTYNDDWRLIIVGDATMSPHEVLQIGGSVEHYNKQAGATWLQRLLDNWPKSVWLNPEPEGYWPYRQSIAIIKTIMHDQMYGLTAAGLERAMRHLSR